MLKYFILFLFFCHSFLGRVQVDTTQQSRIETRFGGRAGGYFTSFNSQLNYFAYFTIHRGNHVFAFGPSFAHPPSITQPYFYTAYQLPYRLNGVDFTYRILPNGSSKVFDFYFQFDFFQKWGRTFGQDYIHNYPNLYDKTEVQVSSKLYTVQTIFEFGFDIKFLKHFYLGPAIGIGGRFDIHAFDYADFNELSYRDSRSEAEFIFRVNVGAKF